MVQNILTSLNLSKARSLISVILCGIVTCIIGHPEKALAPIVFTPLGRVMPVRLSQLKNAPSPISVTLVGIDTFSKLLQLAKAVLPIDVTPSCISIFFRLLQLLKVL